MLESNENKFLANDGRFYDTEEEATRVNEQLQRQRLNESKADLLLEG